MSDEGQYLAPYLAPFDELIRKTRKPQRVFVLYSGGTFGMRMNEHGVYVPEPNCLVPLLRQWPAFHDKLYAEKHGCNASNELALPLCKDGKRIVYVIWEYAPLLDSSNMTYSDYIRLATDIQRNYDQFDGFVILHGTDTMAYTASALSFMLENLGKPVILTGSQIPIFEQRSDGRDNFLSALIMAGCIEIPEVTILFNNQLLRGNRSTKNDAGRFDAFRSPNMAPLASLDIDISVSWSSIIRHNSLQKITLVTHGIQRIIWCNSLQKFTVDTNISPYVSVLRLFPSITEDIVRAFLQPPMLGVVLQTYGAGNGPAARADIMAALKEANDRGVIIVNISQCPRGSVSPLYEAGKELEKVGVIAGCDMTVEAALMKLSYVLGKELSLQQQQKMVATNLRGEMTVTRTKEESSLLEYPLIEKMGGLMQSEELRILREFVFPPMLCQAAMEGKLATVKKLQEAGASFGLSSYDGRTPLHIATCEGHVEVVKYLLLHGAPVHVRDRFGHTAMDDAIEFHRVDIMGLLNQAGARMLQSPDKIGVSLSHCVIGEDLKTMTVLCNAGVDLNQGNYNGRTPLHLAAAHKKIKTCRFLLDHGARTDVKDHFGNTPLDDARAKGHDDVIQVLSTNFGNTPLDDARAKGHDDVIQVLSTNFGNTPLDDARAKGHDDVIQVLSKHITSCNIY